MKITISIINPDTGKPVSIEDWQKQPDPKKAEWILIQSDETKPFLLNKKLAFEGRSATFDNAIKAGNALTRQRAVAVHEAKNTTMLNRALMLIGGDIIEGWAWTCDPATHPNDNNIHAWSVSLTNGQTDCDQRRCSYQMLQVRDWPV